MFSSFWEPASKSADLPPTKVVDESLRDGLQSPSVSNPHLDDKVALLHAMAGLGVDRVSIGLPAASARAVADAAHLLTEIVEAQLPLRPTAAARTTERDVEAIVEISQRVGAPIDVYAFIGSSPIRHLVENWDRSFLTQAIRAAAAVARRAGLEICLVTEDTTRASPTTLTTLWDAAIDAGVSRLCLCDTVGHADPRGVEALVHFARGYLTSRGATHVELDWHGHEDRGLGIANALAAARAGVGAVHGTALGVGERVGNVPIEPLLYNLGLAGMRRTVTIEDLRAYSDLASRALEWPISPFAPLVGDRSRGLDAIRTTPSILSVETTTHRAAPPPLASRDAQPTERRTLRLRVNGDLVEATVRADRTLLEMLRYDLDLVATKQGCDKGDCGACTVLIDGEPQLACLTLAVLADGRSITTAEGLAGRPAGEASPPLDPLLDAFDRCGAGQCGFCTPGMLMTATALLAREPAPSREVIRTAISGNLCRCTGYGSIVSAIELASKIRRGEEPTGVALPGEHVPPPLAPLAEKQR
ncbi:MAG: 2Fe-2S iron-sulfur cluster-binding protein [Polyangiaceae bacterium]